MRRQSFAGVFVFLLPLLILISPSTIRAQARAPLVYSPEVHIPVPPTPVRIAGKRHLAYELHITNLRSTDIELTSVEVLDGGTGKSLALFRDNELTSRLGRPGIRDVKDVELVRAGMRAVVYVWLPLDERAPAPSGIHHRIELESIRPTGKEHQSIETGRTRVLREQAVVLDPPLRGGPWAAVYDPLLVGGHRTSIYVMDGRARIPARYAIDWIKLDQDAKRARGDDSRISNWYGYGSEVLAVADGTIAEAKDDMPEGEDRSTSTGAISLENASGNYITLDMGKGRYAFYEHLKHKSIRMRVGERVKRGQVIAQLGNSGSSSSGPHLHFHVADANATLGAEGLPYVFRSFEVIGAFQPPIEGFASGERWKPAPADAAGRRTLELPQAGSVIMFESGRKSDQGPSAR